VFDEVRYSEGPNRASYLVDSVEGTGTADREESPNLGYKPAHKGGYFPVPPTDTLTDLRTEMALTLEAVGIPVEVFHHEVASGGQCELSMRFNSLKAMADWTMWYKYVVKNVSRKHGKTATFMPKPIFGDNGSGMHCHQSIWKDEKNLFAGDKYAGLSDMALNYIGGILKHAPAHLRLHEPGHEQLQAPGAGLRGAGEPGVLVAQPLGVDPHPDRQRVAEVEAARVPLPRPDGQPVPRVLGMLMAGLDGIQNKIDRASRSTRTSTRCAPRSSRTCRRRRARSTSRSRPSSATTRSSSRATCSRRRSSRPGSTTSVRTRSTRSAASAPVRVRAVLRQLVGYR
jgi:glutamine synthetase